MSTTTLDREGAITSRPSPRRRALTVVRLVLAVQFAIAGTLKLSGSETMVQMFADVGIGQWLRYFVGAVEVGAAIGLLVPAAVTLAALALVALMIGATVTRVAVLGGPPVVEVLFLILAGLLVRQYGEQTLRRGRAGTTRR